MRLSEYGHYDATELAELVRGKQVRATELVDLARAAHERLNPVLNAVVELYEDGGRPSVDDVNPVGPFAGVPMLRKDTGPTEAGRLQEHGSRLFAGVRARHDDFFVQHARAAGLRIVGRTTMPELGMSGASESLAHGVTRNPWNTERSCGGSSSGSAAVVAAGIAPIASGGDGGGSLRIPAAFCGVVGLCPSRGRVSDGPDRQDSGRGRDRSFVLCRSVRDLAAALDVFAGSHPGDPFTVPLPTDPFVHALSVPTQRLRVGLADTSWVGAALAPAVAQAIGDTGRLLEQLGHEVETVAAPYGPELHRRVAEGVFLMSLADLDDTAAELGREIDEETLEPYNLLFHRIGSHLPLSYALRTMEAERALRRQIGEALAGYDMVVTPTMHDTAFDLGTFTTTVIDGPYDEFIDADAVNFSFVDVFNVTGQPALSLPLFQSPAGMPIGIQLVGRFAEEATLITVARDLEEALPWADRRPTVHTTRD
jgi:amidase